MAHSNSLADSFEVPDDATARILAAQRGGSSMRAPAKVPGTRARLVGPRPSALATPPQGCVGGRGGAAPRGGCHDGRPGARGTWLPAAIQRSGLARIDRPAQGRLVELAKSLAPSTGVGALPSHGTSSSGSAAEPITTVPSTIPPLPSSAVGQTARIEQSGTLSLRVRDGGVASTLTSLTALATGSGGYVVDVQSQAGGGGSAPSGTLTMQVPEASFQTVVTQAQHLGRVTSVSTKATDETGQYVDLQARITALEASRQQYLTILAKATSIGDILAVQAQLDTLQSQLEQLQSQLGLLESETTYSTLTVSLSERGAIRCRCARRRGWQPRGTTRSTGSKRVPRVCSAPRAPCCSSSCASAPSGCSPRGLALMAAQQDCLAPRSAPRPARHPPRSPTRPRRPRGSERRLSAIGSGRGSRVVCRQGGREKWEHWTVVSR